MPLGLGLSFSRLETRTLCFLSECSFGVCAIRRLMRHPVRRILRKNLHRGSCLGVRPSLRPTVHDSLRSWSRRNRMRAETRRMFAAHIFVWIRRLAYRIDGARLGIVRCWGLAAVGGLGLICWLACCFFFVGRGCRVFLVPRYLLFSGFLLFLRYLTTKISVILSMST